MDISALPKIDFNALRKRIDSAANELGHTCGWRLLSSPMLTLYNARVAFIGFNPAGKTSRPEHDGISTETGSAYIDEVWDKDTLPGESPLQRQVQALFKGLNVTPDTVLSGNLVPFRSPSEASLCNYKQSLEFGKKIWSELLVETRPSMIICMGKSTTDAIGTILSVNKTEYIPVNWGNINASKSQFSGGQLYGLPHLSRFRIFNRSKSEKALANLFGDSWNAR